MELAPLKLKNMSILKINMFSTEFLSQLAQHPLIEMESLEVELYKNDVSNFNQYPFIITRKSLELKPDKDDVSNFDSILQNKLLIYVTVTCPVSCFTELSDISLRRGFEIKTIVEIPWDKVMFTLSRVWFSWSNIIVPL